ncbi:MAG: sulfatase [Verrucomicrobiaceae bacterium]|nr:sulfatase [Verrucomicrobiaceae bacterium]
MHKELFLMAVFISGISCSLAQEGSRPNILFAFADDWGRHASSYAKADGQGAENDVILTPNFDYIAKRGVLFNNAFVNAPSCTPCRSSILSGQHFWRTGRAAILQGAQWDASIPTWPLLLKKSGYHIGYTWKVWSPGTPRDAPYGGVVNSYSKAGSSFNGFSQTVTNLVKGGKSLMAAKQVLMNQVRGNFRDMLAGRKKGQPFAYWFGPTNVHRKWIKGSGKSLWAIDPDKLKGKLPPFLPDVAEVREDFADYLGEAMAFDMALGVLVEELRKAGEYENTIVAVSGDHGPAGFPHGKCNLYDFGARVALAVAGPGVKGGRVVDDLVTLPDLAATFLESGKVKVPPVMTSRSIWPTLLSPDNGLVDKSRDKVFIGRERHVASSRAGQLPYPQRAIRTRDHLFIINFKPDRYPLGDHYHLGTDKEPDIGSLTANTFVTIADEDAGPTKAWIVTNRQKPSVEPFFTRAYGKRPREELYELKSDPHQMKNMASVAGYRETVTALRNRLMDELKKTKDPRLIEDGRFFETPPMAGPVVKAKGGKKKR